MADICFLCEQITTILIPTICKKTNRCGNRGTCQERTKVLWAPYWSLVKVAREQGIMYPGFVYPFKVK